ncbi:hypothetical protein [Peribacillus butanolivorans]|nr:hypothetical protein [Peribacillus butanolivorans]
MKRSQMDKKELFSGVYKTDNNNDCRTRRKGRAAPRDYDKYVVCLAIEIDEWTAKFKVAVLTGKQLF